MSTADHGAQQKGARRSLAGTLVLDKRLFGMVIAFAILCIVFHIATNGKFMTPRNIFNVAVQTVSVGIMATGMVFVIVSRNIDLSVGSMLAICSAIMAVLQTRFLPPIFGLGNPAILPITIAFGLLVGTGIGAMTGWMVGFQCIPSFIVTLIGAVASIIAVVAVLNARRGKQRHGFIVKPVWAEGVLMALILGAILGFVLLLNSYEIPTQKLKRLFEARAGDAGRLCRLSRPADLGDDPDPCGGNDDRGQPENPLWPLYLCHRWQPGCGGTIGHQHALSDGKGLCPDGVPLCLGRSGGASPPAKPRQ